MKTKVILFLAAAFISGAAFASTPGASKTEKFKVNGKCGMCESRIEQAAKSVEGVSSAGWDKKTLVMTVSFDPSKTDVHKVQSAIAKAGHDTEMHKAGNEAYNKLHSCCKYSRTELKSESSGSQSAAPHCPREDQTSGCCGGSNS